MSASRKLWGSVMSRGRSCGSASEVRSSCIAQDYYSYIGHFNLII